MAMQKIYDYLEIVDGPEDGTGYPISEAPFYLGSDSSCGGRIVLDENVARVQVRLTAVSKGYRVRAMNRNQVRVEGKRAGQIRSRILRAGESLLVGDTPLILACSPQGIAAHSNGTALDSDFLWAIRRTIPAIFKLLLGTLKLPFLLFKLPSLLRAGRIGKLWIIVPLIALVAGYFFVPAVHNAIWYVINTGRNLGDWFVRTISE